eukprot:1609068-Karenia_brevis.AAC.1
MNVDSYGSVYMVCGMQIKALSSQSRSHPKPKSMSKVSIVLTCTDTSDILLSGQCMVTITLDWVCDDTYR